MRGECPLVREALWKKSELGSLSRPGSTEWHCMSLGKMPYKGSPTRPSSSAVAPSYNEGCYRLSVQRALNATESTGAMKSHLVTETQHGVAAVKLAPSSNKPQSGLTNPSVQAGDPAVRAIDGQPTDSVNGRVQGRENKFNLSHRKLLSPSINF